MFQTTKLIIFAEFCKSFSTSLSRLLFFAAVGDFDVGVTKKITKFVA